MSFTNSEIAATKQRRGQVLDELLDVLTRPRDDGFSEAVLRAHMVGQCVHLEQVLNEVCARAAMESDDRRDEALLSLAVLALNRLIRG